MQDRSTSSASVSTVASPQHATTSSWVLVRVAGRSRRGWRKAASASSCSRPGAIRVSAPVMASRCRVTIDCRQTMTCRHSMRSRPKTPPCGGTISSVTTATRRRNVRSPTWCSEEGRSLLSARWHARRMHRAQRDDSRAIRTTRTGMRSRSSQVTPAGQRMPCGGTSSCSRTAGIGRSVVGFRKFGWIAPAMAGTAGSPRSGQFPGAAFRDHQLRGVILASAYAAFCEDDRQLSAAAAGCSRASSIPTTGGWSGEMPSASDTCR